MKRTLGLPEVCLLMKISLRTGRNRLSRGDPMPPSFKTGRKVLFLEDKVDAWLQTLADAGSATDAKLQLQGRPRNIVRRMA